MAGDALGQAPGGGAELGKLSGRGVVGLVRYEGTWADGGGGLLRGFWAKREI